MGILGSLYQWCLKKRNPTAQTTTWNLSGNFSVSREGFCGLGCWLFSCFLLKWVLSRARICDGNLWCSVYFPKSPGSRWEAGGGEAWRTSPCLLCAACFPARLPWSQLLFSPSCRAWEWKAAWFTSPAFPGSVQFLADLRALLHVMAFVVYDIKAVEEHADMIWKRKDFKFSLYIFLSTSICQLMSRDVFFLPPLLGKSCWRI